jgi:hypothetical protein
MWQEALWSWDLATPGVRTGFLEARSGSLRKLAMVEGHLIIKTPSRRGEIPCVIKFGQGTSLFKAPRSPPITLIDR